MRALVRYAVLQHSEKIRFIVSGGIAALCNFGSLYFFADIVGLWYLHASMLSFCIAFLSSFFLQKYWTFKSDQVRNISFQLPLSLGVALVNLCVNTLLMYCFVEYGGVHYFIAQVITAVIIAIETYLIYKNFIFAYEDEELRLS